MPRNPEDVPRFDVFPSYRGGSTTLYGGYVWEFCPGHPLQNRWGFVAQHRLVAESVLGRPLVQSDDEDTREVVHHKDECVTNNDPRNLEVLTSRQHRRLHARNKADSQMAMLTREMVLDALEGRTLTQACEHLGVCRQTIRNRFPELAATRQRRSPSKIDDPETLGKILRYVNDESWTLRMIAKETGVSAMTVVRVCKRNGTPWKKRLGKNTGLRSTYRGKPTRSALKASAAATALGNQ